MLEAGFAGLGSALPWIELERSQAVDAELSPGKKERNERWHVIVRRLRRVTNDSDDAMMNIIAWGNVVPWAEQRQIEQDRIISRAIVDLFADPSLREQLRFRGGTALNKLHFPAPLRYSEDIDLVRTTAEPMGPILD
ncbi:MAG: nucleotidyl transferase AbiEii/AbiGii toxin family protein, partial [Candidatus Acidiferrum sp.]